MRQFIKYVCARQFGKSYGISLFAAAAIATIPGITIAVFAPSEKQSKEILEYTNGFLHKFFPHVEFSKSKRQIKYQFSKTDERSLTAYSSAVDIS